MPAIGDIFGTAPPGSKGVYAVNRLSNARDPIYREITVPPHAPGDCPNDGVDAGAPSDCPNVGTESISTSSAYSCKKAPVEISCLVFGVQHSRCSPVRTHTFEASASLTIEDPTYSKTAR